MSRTIGIELKTHKLRKFAQSYTLESKHTLEATRRAYATLLDAYGGLRIYMQRDAKGRKWYARCTKINQTFLIICACHWRSLDAEATQVLRKFTYATVSKRTYSCSQTYDAMQRSTHMNDFLLQIYNIF